MASSSYSRNKTSRPSSAFSSYTSSFTTSRSTPFRRSCSPTRINLYGHASSTLSVHFSVDRPFSPCRSISVKKQNNSAVSNQKKTCMCSPTTHPGSFRCSLHKGLSNARTTSSGDHHRASNQLSLNLRRSAMTNSLVRIGGVEGDLVRRALSSLIRPSSHHQRRRAGFQPRPSRLSRMSKAVDQEIETVSPSDHGIRVFN